MKQSLFFQIFRSSKIVRPLTLGAMVAATLAGCGGSSEGGGGTSSNPYTGTYAGQFVDSSSSIGAFSMTVSASGSIQGSFGYSPSVTFSGAVDNTGAGSITDTQGTFQVTLGKAGRSTLGAGIGTTGNGFFTTSITNPTGSLGGFGGQYSGTVTNKTLGKTGIIAFTVSTSGTLSGVDLFTVNGTPTLEDISGSVSSGGVISYTVNGVTVSGTVTLSNGTISGPVNETNGDSATISVTQAS